MAYARGVGVSHTAFDELIPEWTPLAMESALGDGWTEASVHRLRVLAQVGEGHTARVIDGNDVLGLFPVNAADNILHIVLTLAAFAAALAPLRDRSRVSTPRTT